MHFLFVGLFAIVLCHQVYRKSEEFCPYQHTMYTIILAPSVVSCAACCQIDKVRCSRFVYDKVQEECMLYQDKESIEVGANYTFGGRSLYLRSNKGTCTSRRRKNSRGNTGTQVTSYTRPQETGNITHKTQITSHTRQR